jgi:hypothetical protein
MNNGGGVTRLQMYAHLYVRVWKRATGRHRTSTSPTSTQEKSSEASSPSPFYFFYFGQVIADEVLPIHHLPGGTRGTRTSAAPEVARAI